MGGDAGDAFVPPIWKAEWFKCVACSMQPQDLRTMSTPMVHFAPLLFPPRLLYCYGSRFRSYSFLLFAAQFFSVFSRRGSRREGFLAEHPDPPGGA